ARDPAVARLRRSWERRRSRERHSRLQRPAPRPEMRTGAWATHFTNTRYMLSRFFVPALAGALAASGQITVAAQPTARVPSLAQPLPIDKNVKIGTLANGIRYY